MGREKLRIADVARITGLNRSTVSALYKGTCTRIELATIEQLCALFKCQVSDILEFVDEGSRVHK
jgi:putative transcriptional regulator